MIIAISLLANVLIGLSSAFGDGEDDEDADAGKLGDGYAQMFSAFSKLLCSRDSARTVVGAGMLVCTLDELGRLGARVWTCMDLGALVVEGAGEFVLSS